MDGHHLTMRILVTGGAGFIGSHTVLELLLAGYDVTVIDDLYRGKEEALRRVEEMAGKSITFVKADLRDAGRVEAVFAAQQFDGVIHFAGYKAVGESVIEPLSYYSNNIGSTLVLLDTMKRHGCKKIVFSSSCTVYGQPDRVPITEASPLHAINPYGRTKLAQEDMFRDIAGGNDAFSVLLLRYFNPVGAHPSGKIGEDPCGIPTNLFPYMAQVAVGRRPSLRIFGGDYPTPDGTCVRDYIHVVDLAKGHVFALQKLDSLGSSCVAVNLGTGIGYSVLDVLWAFERIIGHPIPYEIVARRVGDAVVVYSNPSYAAEFFGWHATHTLDEMCRDMWAWQSHNPEGYAEH